MVGRLRTIDARTLADAVLEPPGYAVKDLLVQGLHILAGAPKTGKSWLALWLCQQVAGGEKVWGHPTQQGTVLYLCLEDGYRRLQDRLLDITEDPSENLYLATHAGTLADGLAGQIETFVREHGRVSLIVIDTLQKVRETCTDNTYARDYADLARLKELADRCRTTVLLVHHLRKQYDSDPLNRVSGTAGMSGAVPFPVSWTVKMKKKQKETQDILSYHTQAAGCSDKARAKASGGRQPIEECGRTGL